MLITSRDTRRRHTYSPVLNRVIDGGLACCTASRDTRRRHTYSPVLNRVIDGGLACCTARRDTDHWSRL